MKILYLILAVLFYLPSFALGQIGEFVITEVDKKLYGDLLQDKQNERFLKIFFFTAHGDIISLSDYQWGELDWANAQKEIAFPVLLEVLKREKSIDYSDQGDICTGIIRKQALLGFVKKNPQGDPQAFLNEVRRQLPEWNLPEWQFAKHDMHTGFIREALDLLAREGDASDIPLIESFLDDVNGMNKESAQKNLTKLNERLAAEAADKSRVQRGFKSGISRGKPASLLNEANNSEEKIADEKKYHLPSIIAGVLLVLILAFLLKTYKRKFKP
jgi:hypothetical protein